MSVSARLGRLLYRSKEAENALRQLETCIDVINSKSKDGSCIAVKSGKVRELEAENARLKEEASRLKEKLVQLELLNGVPQIPCPQPGQPFQQVSMEAAQDASQHPDPAPTSAPPPSSAPTKTENKEKEAKKAKQKEKQPKSSAGGGSKGGERPVDVSRLDFRIGQIVSVKKHPDADTLYVEEIDLAEEKPRTVCSGLVQQIPINKMENRMVVILCNLKPVKMRGVVSEAMVMCASSPDQVEILDPPEGVVPGDKVIVEGYEGVPDDLLNPKKKIFEQVQPDLHTNDMGVACYKNIPWTVPGKGVMKSQTMKNSSIK